MSKQNGYDFNKLSNILSNKSYAYDFLFINKGYKRYGEGARFFYLNKKRNKEKNIENKNNNINERDNDAILNKNKDIPKIIIEDNRNSIKLNKNKEGEKSEIKTKINFEKKEMNINEMKQKLLKSRLGFYNAGGSCYMASIIQILIHLEKFLNEFLENKYEYTKPLSNLFFNFIKEIADSKENAIEIKRFANEYNKINNKFDGEKGNNPMTFFNEFIKKLGKENNGKIMDLFTGKKYLKFIGMPELDYEEDFIFYLISLDEKTRYIKNGLNQEKEFEDDEDMKLIEEIKIKPEILVINLEIENIEYDVERELMIDDILYELKAINRYNNFHSTA